MNILGAVYKMEFNNLNILECGSHIDGGETKFFRNNNNCYYIEANPHDYIQMLNQSDVPKQNIFNYALSDYCGETKFTLTTHPGNSSIKHSEEHKMS
jgi:hypothetical protein